MKKLNLLTVLLLFAVNFFAQKITRGPELGEIYFLGPTATVMYDAIYRSANFGETAVCVDSLSALSNTIEAITADKTLGGLYFATMGEALHYSEHYGQSGTWQLQNGGVSYRISAGRNEGEIFNTIISHSNDYGINFINHSLQGYFGSLKTFDIGNDDGLGYCITNSYEVDDTLYFFISFDNFNSVEVVNKFNFMDGEYVQLSRENNSGNLYLYNENRKNLFFCEDFGANWVLKNVFLCPNLPIIGVTGGRQDGEFYLLVEYLQMMGQRRHVYIYHSLDYGETFTVYHPVAIGPDPIYANFIASDTLVVPCDTVQFTDLSNDAETWEWDFDNDGIIDSYEQNPTHTYQDTGYYTVKLSITGAGGIIQDYGIRNDYIHVDNLTNIDFVVSKENKISIFPNPLKDQLNITISSNLTGILCLSIYNLHGEIVRHFSFKKENTQKLYSIPVTDLQNGIYFLNIVTPEQSQTKKVIINH